MLTPLKQPINQSSTEINELETDASCQTSKKTKLKELSMSHKLLWWQTSRGKSWSVYILTHLQENLKVHENTTHMDNLICKVINDESNLSHEHLVKGSNYAPRMKPDAIHLYLNKSM